MISAQSGSPEPRSDTLLLYLAQLVTKVLRRCKDVIDWLLASDPAIRWQVMRDLLGAPTDDWKAEQAKIEAHGCGVGAYR